MKNLAGKEIAVFLFQFELGGTGINFMMNELIAEEMYADIDQRLQPLVQVCSETLLRYKHLSVGSVIMDGTLHFDGQFEVVLSKGLGQHFFAEEKQRLFEDAARISDLLQIVMTRRSKEARGEPVTDDPDALLSLPQPNERIPFRFEGDNRIEHIKRCTPDDLPSGVRASKGYDHRGECYLFEHTSLGHLGKIVLVPQPDNSTLMISDISHQQEPMHSKRLQQKKQLLQDIIDRIEARMLENNML